MMKMKTQVLMTVVLKKRRRSKRRQVFCLWRSESKREGKWRRALRRIGRKDGFVGGDGEGRRDCPLGGITTLLIRSGRREFHDLAFAFLFLETNIKVAPSQLPPTECRANEEGRRRRRDSSRRSKQGVERPETRRCLMRIVWVDYHVDLGFT